MTEHTKEPWCVAEKTSVRLDIAYLVRPVYHNNYEYGATVAAISERDARRIVACVNACSRISDEELHEADLWQRFHSQSNVIVNVTQQRDELLEALKKVQSFISEINNAGGKYAGLHGDVVRDSYAENTAAIEVIESIEGKF